DILDGKMMQEDGTIDAGLRKFSNAKGKTDLLKWLKTQRLYPGKLGTGTYSKFQESTYELIRKAIKEDNELVSLGTKSKIAAAREVTGSGSSGGEAKAWGLAGSHAYTAIDCKLNKSDGLLYVKVRNPWGSYSRKYLKASEAKADLDTKLADALKQSGHATFSAFGMNDVKDLDATALTAHLTTANIHNKSKVKMMMQERKVIADYAADTLIPYAVESSVDTGESWLELSDLTKRFSAVYVGS
ncbi:MAG: hypothetical protein AAFV80_23700, partial [Bacteroidota bacterium]